ncbi:hypothetical protein [Denitratisoma oestradiolicum]|uniref:Uncharacterized protein n=1 Tax=Denitratisoma oestradiolicum TaxID=311182 RepID=A0A6S6XP15_9PROT|nr:hypothetical protein [Denitratisoma oestradiolicum]TWO80526.1 hypothetical protein CBW56_08790 [Denitratisoma oestradiolicum]CAB1367596.1 conserved protein of unknown function [Denitratisoma oestradiolicum]
MNTLATAGRQAGISKFEFAVIVTLVGLLSLSLNTRLKALEEEGERTEVELTVRNMRVGLQLAIGERIMRGEESRLAELVGANPVSFLGHVPRHYMEGDGSGAAPGVWWFDPDSRALGYRPRQPEAFAGMAMFRWQVRAKGELGGKVVGLRLERIAPN